jgi:F0F1-type ATP synthase assembly protein I
MEGEQLSSAFKLMDTILGAVIVIAGLGLIIYSLTNPALLSLISMGIIGALIGVGIIYAAKRYG